MPGRVGPDPMGDQPQLIEPRTLRGFRDYLPETMLPRERLMELARGVYRSYGFAPIDTPALEYEEILLGKGGAESDKQMYAFEDQGGRRVALRFDLTVPLARFAAQHAATLGMPFKRYHIGPVWRGENTQRGRYREFVQCDFDTIGTESVAADVETALVIHDLLDAAGAGEFTIHVNDRRVLSGVLERQGLEGSPAPILRALDKLAKIGPDGVRKELCEQVGLADGQVDALLSLCELRGTPDAVLGALEAMVGTSERGRVGLDALRSIARTWNALALPPARLVLDASIARGLDYYTGPVFETLLAELPAIGSVCSGGRYDDLASLYTKQRLPGIGASLGVDRLLAALEELGRIEKRAAAAPVFLPWFGPERLADLQVLARRLRRAGIGVELYPEPRKLGAQLKYADRKGFRLALIVGDEEWQRGEVQLKDLVGGEVRTIPQARLVDEVRGLLATSAVP